ncbi:MAG: superoxide dismutase [Desulfobacterales bacterium]|jgi:Fe-Mn family superoxide dismutase|nr:superoxide dismutase [Desulfobacterales bacterium]
MSRNKSDKKRSVFSGLSVLLMVGLAFAATHCGKGDANSPISQEPLPYAENALEPYISAETMRLHYGKHHAGYVARANHLLQTSPFGGKSVLNILRETAGKAEYASIFNNVAQAWNHSFFWKSMKPGGGGAPAGILLEKINASFGGVDEFKKAFIAAAGEQFGSGWVWLVQEGNALKIMATSNADTPIAHGRTPLFTVDVWEHAYYVDYRNRRTDFVQGVLDNLVNWEFAAARLESNKESQ